MIADEPTPEEDKIFLSVFWTKKAIKGILRQQSTSETLRNIEVDPILWTAGQQD